MPVKKKQTQERRRSTRIQHQEEEKRQEDQKKRTNLKDLLKRSNSSTTATAPSKGSKSSSIEQDGDFVFKRTGSSQPVTNVEKQKKPTSKKSTTAKKDTKKQIRRLNPEDVTITPQRNGPPKKKSRKAQKDDHYEEHSTSFQISLPISDTPIIRRNQKLRKENENGIRRSSLGNRGKRVSSIGNGFSAVPHDKVPTNEFYKHLDSDLPDPHKMRQLLTWVAKRVFDEDKNKHIKRKNKLPTEEITALNIAKVIKEELVKDLSDGKINISWWNRPDEDDEDDTNNDGNKLEKTLVPNEKNVKNAKVLNELKEKLEILKKDSSNWEKYINKKIDIPTASNDLDSIPTMTNDELYKKIIDSSTISEISSIENSTFNDLNNNLEKSLDNFNDFIHTLKSSSSIRSRFVKFKSKQLAEILDQTFDDDTIELIKNNEVNKDVDTHQLLKGISRLDK